MTNNIERLKDLDVIMNNKTYRFKSLLNTVEGYNLLNSFQRKTLDNISIEKGIELMEEIFLKHSEKELNQYSMREINKIMGNLT